MNIGVFLLLMAICLGLVYLVHKYFGKKEYYVLGIIYSIISFILSFKIINIFGMNINANVIFSSGLLLILYYFVNRYNEKESRRFIFSMISITLVCTTILVGTSVMVPSIYDGASAYYENMVFDNLAILILYPISMAITMFLSEYCFKELKKEEKKKNIKTILTLFGIVFIDTAVFIYFSYAFIIRFNASLVIAVDNYIVKIIIMIIYVLIINRLFMVRKVK